MAITIELPHVGESVVEGTIGKWLKQPGDKVQRYEPLVEVVTDKVTMEVPSPVAGSLLKILAQEGETIPMGAPIAEMESTDSPPPPSTVPASQSISRPAAAAKPAGTTGYLLHDVGPVGPIAWPLTAAMEGFCSLWMRNGIRLAWPPKPTFSRTNNRQPGQPDPSSRFGKTATSNIAGRRPAQGSRERCDRRRTA